jgi:HD-like signal output (HDOD) protein
MLTPALPQARPQAADMSVTMSPKSMPATPTVLPRDLAGWSAWFCDAEIPVLGATAETIDALGRHEDDVDAHLLAESVAQDPLMTLRLLVHVARQPWHRRATDAETVTAALVMLGIGPFFAAFADMPTVEERLAAEPAALAGFRVLLQRVHRAAAFALCFAVHRMDRDAAVIHEAALLHDFAEMLLWCHAPAAALEILSRQRADPTLRSADAQQAVLGIPLASLQQRLMKAWRLPALLVRISDDAHADTAQVRNVHLAMRLARHTANGWDNPAVPDDVADVAALLNLGEAPTRTLLAALEG